MLYCQTVTVTFGVVDRSALALSSFDESRLRMHGMPAQLLAIGFGMDACDLVVRPAGLLKVAAVNGHACTSAEQLHRPLGVLQGQAHHRDTLSWGRVAVGLHHSTLNTVLHAWHGWRLTPCASLAWHIGVPKSLLTNLWSSSRHLGLGSGACESVVLQ